MALKIVPAPTFEFDAMLTVPGAAERATLRLVAKHKGREALNAWIDGAAKSDDPQFLGSAFSGWYAVLDDKGAEVPYSVEALAKVLDAYPASGRELFEQYLAALTESRRKN